MTSKRTYGNPSPQQLEYEIAVEAERKRRANAWLELDELRAENERLRAALEKIAGMRLSHPSWHVKAAEEALSESWSRQLGREKE